MANKAWPGVVEAPAFAMHVIAAAARPPGRAFQRVSGACVISGIFDALVEDHGDVRTERLLNLDGFFRREEMFRTVQVRTEHDAVIGDLAEIGEAENLKAAGIGEDRPRPGHETMQAAELANQLVARTQIEMIRVAKQNLNAQIGERLLRHALHGSSGPTGMNAGVSTTP